MGVVHRRKRIQHASREQPHQSGKFEVEGLHTFEVALTIHQIVQESRSNLQKDDFVRPDNISYWSLARVFRRQKCLECPIIVS